MSKVNWKKVLIDALKAAGAVILGALFGSCTCYHFGITHLTVKDNNCIDSIIDESVKSYTHYADSVVTYHVDLLKQYDSGK